MSIIGTFNNWNIISIPSSPGFRTVTLEMTDTVASSTSPFSLQTQFYTWAGADLWSGTASLPEMTAAQAAPWIAFLAEARGRANVFAISDPLGKTPRGSASGSPVIDNSVAGNNQPGMTTLYTSGWTASTTNLLLPRDYISFGYRLYMVLDTVNSDANGKAAISIWPSLREAATGSIYTSNCAGLFRLADNKRQWSMDYTRLSTVTLSFIEAR